jgi:hypothetical protein
LQNKNAKKDPNPSGCKNTRTRAQNPNPVLTLTLAQSPNEQERSRRKNPTLSPGAPCSTGKPRRGSAAPAILRRHRTDASRAIPSSWISTAPLCVGQRATPSPLDGGALTSRRARSPARRPAAAPSPRSPSRLRGREGGAAEEERREWLGFSREMRAIGGFDPPKSTRDRRS